MPQVKGAETYTISVSASKEGYRTETINESVIKVNKATVTIPTLSATSKTYSGSSQSPTVNNYSSTYMTQTGTTSATNAGTYTVTWALKDTTNCQWSDGTTANKSATWTIAKTALKNVITATNYGDSVNYSVTVKGVTLNKWRIFYNDGSNVIMIYNEYLPISTGLTGPAVDSAFPYGIFSTRDRIELINHLNNTNNWKSLLNGNVNLSSKATAKGAVDLPTWVASWNAKGYTKLYTKTTSTSDGLTGYYVGTSANPTSYDQSVSSNAGYNDTLYFPYKDNVSSCYGYWLASPSVRNYSLLGVCCNGWVEYNSYTDSWVGVCPAVYLTSNILTSGKNASGAWIIE